jgi:preprotein translocase subunit SecG
MRSLLVLLLTLTLVCTSVFAVLVILMQKPSANSGMGASLGGGAAESAFGSDATKVLTRWTVGGIAMFFLLSFTLSMVHIYANSHKKSQYLEINLDSVAAGGEFAEK